MRPLLLEIEGFNSFLQKETIDFETLTSRGIFGIFGSTGSGKSSILDAIIFALYGKTPRETSMGTLINTSTDTAKVRYLFSIKGENAGTYEIQRKIKKTPSSTTTPILKLLKKSPAEDELLAEKRADFDKGIQDIIGLEYSEFIKTVVLPQGQFSSFLMSENKERKKILENVFSLQKYGEELENKISNEKKELETKNKSITDQMVKYQDINQEQIDETTKKIKEIEEKIAKDQEEIAAKEKDYSIQKNILDTSSKIKDYEENLSKISSSDEIIARDREKLEDLEKIEKIIEKISSYTPLKSELKNLITSIETLEKDEKNLLTLRKENSYIYDKLSVEKEKIPEEKNKIEKYNKAIKDIEEKEKLGKKFAEIKENLQTLNEIVTDENQNLKNSTDTYTANTKKIENLRKEIDDITGDSAQNRKIQEHYTYLIRTEENQTQIQKNTINLQDIRKKISNITEIGKEKKSAQDKIETRLTKLKSTKISEEYTPDAFANKNETYQKTLSLYQEVEEINAQIKIAQDTISQNTKENQETKKNYDLEKSLLDNINLKIENIKLQSQIASIQNTLHKGDTCPVCGNTYHNSPQKKEKEDIDSLITSQKSQEKKVNSIRQNLDKIDIEIDYSQKNLAKLNAKLDNYPKEIMTTTKDRHIEEFDKYKLAYSKAQMEKRGTEKEIENLTKDKENLAKELSETRQEYKVLDREEKYTLDQIQKLTGENKILEEKISIFQKENQISDLKERYALQLQKEEKLKPLKDNYQNLVQKNTEIEENIGKIKKKIEKYQIEEKNLLLEQNSISTTLDNLDKTIDGYDFLKEKDKTALKNDISIITAKIAKVEQDYLKAKSDKEIVDKNLQATHTQIEVNKATYKEKTNQYQKIEQVLENFVKDNNYKSIDSLIEYSHEITLIPSLKEKITSHTKEKEKITYAIKTLKAQIGDKKTTKEEVEKLHLEIEEMKNIASIDKERIGSLKNSKKTLELDLQEKKNLIKDNQTLAKKLNNISKLQNLLKGRRYVQFLSKYNLNTICRMSSKTLMQISSGRYELIMDSEGEFLIRDYKNAGIERKPSSLSGGEIFIVSMSLALALSTKIQLKGKARLEFFFLDEGFGTLDQDTLYEALDCLENLKNDNLSIGIISHVEAIKNFVPIKLELSPPTIGKGSSVEIKI